MPQSFYITTTQNVSPLQTTICSDDDVYWSHWVVPGSLWGIRWCVTCVRSWSWSCVFSIRCCRLLRAAWRARGQPSETFYTNTLLISAEHHCILLWIHIALPLVGFYIYSYSKWQVCFWSHFSIRSSNTSASSSSQDSVALVLDGIKSAVRFQKTTSEAWLKVGRIGNSTSVISTASYYFTMWLSLCFSAGYRECRHSRGSQGKSDTSFSDSPLYSYNFIRAGTWQMTRWSCVHVCICVSVGQVIDLLVLFILHSTNANHSRRGAERVLKVKVRAGQIQEALLQKTFRGYAQVGRSCYSSPVCL